MPVRNGARFITEAIDSVARQLAPNDEILVINDASTDDTRSKVAGIGDPRIRVLDGVGRGVSSARNIGLAAAAGEFIAFLDHDDLWPAGRHEAMMEAMRNDQQLDAVFARIRIQVDPDGIRWPWLRHQDNNHAPGTNLGNALFRSTMLRKIDGFDEGMRFGEDLDYFIRLQRKGIRFVLCDVEGLIHRRHATNATNDHGSMKHMVFDLIRRRTARTSRLNLR